MGAKLYNPNIDEAFLVGSGGNNSNQSIAKRSLWLKNLTAFGLNHVVPIGEVNWVEISIDVTTPST